MTHAWLFTGPPGSGRSTAARAFAAALQCPDGGCGQCRECRTALDGSHADVKVVATEGLSIKVAEARALVQEAALRPSVGRWRIIIIEDADRLTAYTDAPADALLKALEEPTPRTVWMLCAPSLEDVIVTIRSRSRHVRLRTPPVEAVAELLQRRDGVDPAMALYAARAAQSHVGLARRLARDEQARIRRRDVIAMATKILGVGDAIGAAADLAQIADEESTASSAERDAAERARLMETLGADPTRPHPAAPHPLAGRRARARAEDARHPLRPRRRRPRPRRPHVRSTATRSCCGCAPTSTSSTRTPSTRCGHSPASSAPSSCSPRWTPSTRPETASTPTCPPLLALEAMALQLRVPARPRRLSRAMLPHGGPDGNPGSGEVTTRTRRPRHVY